MRSDAAPRAPYREGPSAGVPPLTVRYVPFVWSAPIPSLLIAFAAEWATRGELATERLEHAAVALVFALCFAAAHFPIVTIRARVEGGDVIVEGGRWPGSKRTWNLTPREAEAFELGVAEDAKHRLFRGLTLRTSDGRALDLTESWYRGGAWLHARPLARLNAWLESAHGG